LFGHGHASRDRFRTIAVALALHDELDGVLMFALALAQLKVGAGALFWPMGQHLTSFVNIRRHSGDSPAVLAQIIPSLEPQTLFFLDAHWGPHSPLLDELAVIASAGIRPVIMIHDFFNPEHPDMGYDTWDQGRYDWKLIEASVEKIYGDGYAARYNNEATGARRGVIYIEPTE
jgi:hypothetical protein